MVESHRQEIAKLEALYTSNPGGRVFVHLAEALRRAGEHERARSILEEGLARHPDSASGYVVLGRVLIDRGEAGEAETAFRKVLQLDGGNLVALRCLGDLARGSGRPAEAVKHYRELIARNPSSAADGSLQRLLDEAQRNAAEAAAVAAAAREQEAVDAADRDSETAGAVPSDSAAPGRVGGAEPAEPAFGIIELESLPGDLASFAGLARPEQARVVEEPEPEPSALEDEVIFLIESSAAPLELTELETGLAASPAEVSLLSALPESEPDVVGDAAVLDLSDLSSAAPYEVVPEATELTLVDDDTVRVPMAAPEGPGEAAEEATAFDELPVREEAVPEQPTWPAADIDLAAEEARTQDAAELAGAEAAGDTSGYEDLPWLVEPAETGGAFAGAGAEEEPGAVADSAVELAIPAEPAVEREEPAVADVTADAGLEVPPVVGDPSAAAVAGPAGDLGDYFALPVDLAAEFEAPADEIAAEPEPPREAAWAAAEADSGTADLTASGDHAEAEPDLSVFAVPEEAPAEWTPLDEVVVAEPDAGAFREPGAAAADFTPYADEVEAEPYFGPLGDSPDVTPAGEVVEAGPDFAAFPELAEAAADDSPFGEAVEIERHHAELDDEALGELTETVPGLVELGQPLEAELEPGTFAEPVEPAPDLAVFSGDVADRMGVEPDVEPDHARFAEDVEAEPDLATFMDAIESEKNAAGFVADSEFVTYDEGAQGEPELATFDEAVAGEPRPAEYIEDVEAEPDLAGFAAEIEAEATGTDYIEYVEQDERGFAEFAEREEAESDRASDLAWLDDEFRAAEAAAPASGNAEIDELEPLAGPSVEPTAWQEEIAATGGPEPTTVPDVFDELVERPATGAEPTATPVPDTSPTGDPLTAAAASAAATERALGTETLADLYLAQGFAQRAAEVYRALQQQRPQDERIAAKLRDAEAALAAGRSGDEDAGEVWLRGVESAWTGSAGATGQETTPYAWTEREEQEQGIGIGAYLRELISWGTGEPVRPEHGAGEDPLAAMAEAPPAEHGATAPPAEVEPEAWGATGTLEPAAAEPESGVPWPAPPEPVPDETWTASEPGEPWSAPLEEPPLEPWLAPEPTAKREAPLQPRGTDANAVEEAFNEWFGAPQDPAAPVASEASARPRPALETDAGEQRAEAEDEDDEDLEMFRAWLQSLKK